MKDWFDSLYGRISAIFLVLLLIFAGAQLLVGLQSARDYAQEADQTLNRDLARDLVKTFQPAVADGINQKAVRRLMGEMMTYNPRIEIYLLDKQGRLIFAGDKEVRRKTLDLEPIESFADPSAPPRLPLLGDDPRHENRRKPFSVAPIRIAGEPGYLYLILGGAQYESIEFMAGESYIVRNSLLLGLGTFALFAAVGLILFFLLTKRLRAMVGVVRAFERGQFDQRISDEQRDEIGQLGKAFNEMADNVVANLEQVQTADRRRRELVANVSHDLASPLSSIQGYLETIMMKEVALHPEARRKFLGIIYNNVRRLSSLVGELFELSKLETRQIEPRMEAFALPELAQDVVLKFKPQADESRVRLESDCPRRVPFVRGDIGMIERVLVNLIDNALRHTGAGGEVRIGMVQTAATLRVCVSDTGDGIPAEDLPHIFDRFYRVDKSRSRDSRESSGSGIGLAIAKSILENHDSDITVESSPGRGATFTFELPLLSPERHKAAI